ncbi:uncharacterized protein LOC105736004 [Apis florea]|uniref:uncharacterized protein LOC105736004 n=1 Tax=Apis florea TaxID=7463 RepID=UPI0006292A1E|nr:uncharacterized protein LOC105736004 [Apis florea]
MFASRSYLLISILAVASGAPKIRIKSSIPTWYLPCGEILEIDESNEEASTDVDVKLYVQRLKIQHNLTLSNYLLQDYDYLYEKVRIGVNEHQYIPNWVPGKKDANAMKRRIKSALSPQTIVNHFPKLHEDLQKFAVAFEELVEDETNPKIYNALQTTQIAIKSLLCEVEITIMDLPYLRIPSRVERSIMSNVEREPVDETRRLVRDWGILLKYRDYLHAWKRIFDY